MATKEDVRLYYNELAQGLFNAEKRNIHLKSRMTAVFELISKYAKERGKCLDLGCGTGYLLHHLCKDGFSCTGVDISAKSLAITKERLSIIPGCKIELIESDIQKVNLPSNHFDLITLTDVIEHVEQPDALISEIYRLLKDDGIFIISAPNWYNIYGLGRIVYEKILRRAWPAPIDNWLSPSKLKKLTLENNFNVIELRGTYFLPLTKSLPYQSIWYDGKYSRFENALSHTIIGRLGLYLVAALHKKRS